MCFMHLIWCLNDLNCMAWYGVSEAQSEPATQSKTEVNIDLSHREDMPHIQFKHPNESIFNVHHSQKR